MTAVTTDADILAVSGNATAGTSDQPKGGGVTPAA